MNLLYHYTKTRDTELFLGLQNLFLLLKIWLWKEPTMPFSFHYFWKRESKGLPVIVCYCPQNVWQGVWVQTSWQFIPDFRWFRSSVNTFSSSSRGTNQFSIHVSAKPDSDWDLVLRDNLAQIFSGTECSAIPLHTFLVERRARYVKIILETYYEKSLGLKYVKVNHREH